MIGAFVQLKYISLYWKLKAQQPKNCVYAKLSSSDSTIEHNIAENDGLDSNVDVKFREVIQQLRKSNSPKKIFRFVQDECNNGTLNQHKTMFAFRTLHRMNRTDVCVSLTEFWNPAEHSSNPELTLNLVKSLCKFKKVDVAENIINKVGIFLSYAEDKEKNQTFVSKIEGHIELRILAEIAFGLMTVGLVQRALSVLEVLKNNSFQIENSLSKMVMVTVFREGTIREIRHCLRLLLHLGGMKDNDSMQLLPNNFMKSIEFVKGAVSMETLPPPACLEVAFIGRSNVGKSSLINMICNKKKLVFTSKTPGKTKEFNYFDAKGVVGAQNENHRFYLVDLPGVGYAEVTKTQREGWLDLLKKYVSFYRCFEMFRSQQYCSDYMYYDLTTIEQYVNYEAIRLFFTFSFKKCFFKRFFRNFNYLK